MQVWPALFEGLSVMKLEKVTKAKDEVNPIAMYFPSGYKPDGDQKSKWEVHSGEVDGLSENLLIGHSVSLCTPS